MADSVGSDSAALGKEDGTSSQKHCTACRVPVKDHIGPHGKEKCVLGVLKSLRERISALEEVVEQNELRHAEELREQSALHAKRVDSLMALIENLQQQHSTAADVKVPEAGIAGSSVGRDGVSVVSPSVDEVLPTAPDVQASAPAGPGEVDRSESPTEQLTYAGVLSKPPSSAVEPEQEEDQEGFLVVRSKRQRRGDKADRSNRSTGPLQSGPHKNHSRGDGSRASPAAGLGRLRGAQRVKTAAFHLRGISMDCSADDIVAHCRQWNVTATGCFMLRTRVWGTQLAKLFIAKGETELVMSPDFWPEFICCRPWERDPPRGAVAKYSESA